MTRYLTTTGLILKKYPSNENDWTISVFSPDLGKIQALCRSSRKISSQKGSHLDPLNICHFQFYKKNDRYLLTDCKVENTFLPIRSDLQKTLTAFQIIEILLRSVQEEGNSELFKLTLESLSKLASNYTPLHLEEFKIRMLKNGGSWPDISQCFHCQNSWNTEKQIHCDSSGHLICHACHYHTAHQHQNISFPVIKLAKYISEHTLGQLQPRLSAEQLFQLKTITGIFLKNYLQQELRSENILLQA